jgi:hypothetical protein
MRDKRMADLEKLALRRDRGYLVRLILMLAVGLVVALAMYGWLTGAGVSGCLAVALGSEGPGKSQAVQH